MDVTTSDLRLWIGALASGVTRCAPSAGRLHRCGVFRYLMSRHGLDSNPASGLILAKIPKNLPVYIRKEDTERILDDVDSETDR